MSVSDVSESVGTSIQNATYHVSNLRNAGLVAVVDTWYSSKGTEMTVYATTHEPLVISLEDRVDESLTATIEDTEPGVDELVVWD